MPILEKFGSRTGSVDQAMAALLQRDSYRPAKPAERVCGAVDCRHGWVPPWKKRNRPIFEQEWGCSARCVSSLVAAAVRREVGDGIRAEPEHRHRHRVPLGLVLLAQGWITHPQLQTALASQRASGKGRIGDWLTQSCGLEQERVTRGLGVQWNCAVLATDGFSPSAMALAMPKRLIAEFGMLPLRVAGSALLYLAFQDRMDAATALGVERMSGLRVESGLLAGPRFEAAQASVLAADAAPARIKLVADRDALTAGIVAALEQHQPVAAKLVRVHQYYWLRLWLESGALAGPQNLPPSPADVEDYLFLVS